MEKGINWPVSYLALDDSTITNLSRIGQRINVSRKCHAPDGIISQFRCDFTCDSHIYLTCVIWFHTIWYHTFLKDDWIPSGLSGVSRNTAELTSRIVASMKKYHKYNERVVF